jgi:hypothetical protein
MNCRFFGFLFFIFLPACGLNNFASLSMPNEDFQLPSLQSISLDANALDVIYDGGGAVTFAGSDLQFEPAVAQSSSQTHSTLILLKDTETTGVNDFILSVDVTVTAQLRTGSTPNPWETFWFFFNYTGAITDKSTNYYISKPSPTGSELGIATQATTQVFLDSNDLFPTAIGDRHLFLFIRQGSVFKVIRDGLQIYSYEDAGRLLTTKGALGLYVEDASVEIHSLQYKNMD